MKIESIIIKNFNVQDGYKLPYYAEYITSVEECIITPNGSYWKNKLRYEFNINTKILNIFSTSHKILGNDIEVTYSYDNYKLRKNKIQKILSDEKSK